MRKTMKIGLVIVISIILLVPASMVIADDTEPPVISSISYGPLIGVLTDPGFHLYQECNVTDNVSVQDVRIDITGPVGFTPINVSMVNTVDSHYYYDVSNVSYAGTYEFYIWAIDTSNNTAQSDTYYMLVFDSYQSYIYVDVNNTLGPWNGTAQYPLQSINDALTVLADNGTIFVYEGVYVNTSLSIVKNMSIIGENQALTILDGGGLNNSVIIQLTGNLTFSISYFTLQNAAEGLQIQNGRNSTISHCTFLNCANSGLTLSQYQYLLVTDSTFQNNNKAIQLTNSSFNQFYHNNFINNTIHVSCYNNATNNTWDNNVTGNYWDNYQVFYPNASIIPATGTWDIPYLVNTTGDNTDYHPWVYPNGFIDTVLPTVMVINPNGGEIVTGVISIRWSAFDDLTPNLNGTIRIDYSADDGINWTEIAPQLDNTGFYQWNTSSVPDGTHYLIRVSATDEFSNIGSDTSNASFIIGNHMPVVLQISGPSAGGRGIIFNFTALAIDPDGGQIYYEWDWGDGNSSGWIGPVDSNIPLTTSHAWGNDSNYTIQVKVKDINDIESLLAIHNISIAPQINFSNLKLGYLYFNLFTFNQSYIYSDFLNVLKIVVVLTTHDLEMKTTATDIVQSVTFKAVNLWADVNATVLIDNNGTDGFSCTMNISRGLYEFNVSAYDINGTLVDKYSLPIVIFLRIGKYAMGPSENLRHLLFRRHLLRH
jgi:hypothetical protein